jgi:hypothetical protein
MKCLRLTTLGGATEYVVPGPGMKFWLHKPGETRLTFLAGGSCVCSETPEEIAIQLESIDGSVQIDGIEQVIEHLSVLADRPWLDGVGEIIEQLAAFREKP